MLAGHAFALSVMMYSLPSHVLSAANILPPLALRDAVEFLVALTQVSPVVSSEFV